MYAGELKSSKKEEYIYDEELKRMIKKEITYSDGLLKIYDEILANATD